MLNTSNITINVPSIMLFSNNEFDFHKLLYQSNFKYPETSVALVCVRLRRSFSLLSVIATPFLPIVWSTRFDSLDGSSPLGKVPNPADHPHPLLALVTDRHSHSERTRDMLYMLVKPHTHLPYQYYTDEQDKEHYHRPYPAPILACRLCQ